MVKSAGEGGIEHIVSLMRFQASRIFAYGSVLTFMPYGPPYAARTAGAI